MNNLIQRVITGAIFGIVMIFSILFSQWSVAILLFLISLLGLLEFYRINKSTQNAPQIFTGIFIAHLIFIIFIASSSGFVDVKLLLIIVPLTALIFIIEMYRNKSQPFINIALTLAGIIYITVPMMLLFYIGTNFMAGVGTSYHGNLLMGLFILLWSSDTGAYLSGSKLGKHKLFERLSPKKSWEGFFGGLITAIIAAAIISKYFDDLNLLQWIIAAIIIVTTGTLGDLVESMLKRSAGVKDSGSLLPAHGGILDRFDGLFIAVPFIFYYLLLIGKF